MRKEDKSKEIVRRRTPRLRPQLWEKDKTDRGSEGAKEIREEIERLSSFKLKPIGVAVESGYVPNLKVESKILIMEFFTKGERLPRSTRRTAITALMIFTLAPILTRSAESCLLRFTKARS
jgi:hypothetical protein